MRIFPFFLLFLFMLFLGLGCNNLKLSQKYFKKGINFRAKGEAQKALQAFDQVIALFPDNYQAWIEKGNILQDLGQYPQAIKCFDQALRIKPDEVWALYPKGRALYYLGDFAGAIETFDEIIRLYPNFASAWYDKGFVLRNQQKHSQAIKYYDQALNLTPEDPDLWFDKGFSLEKLKREKEALACYEKMLALKKQQLKSAGREKGEGEIARLKEAPLLPGSFSQAELLKSLKTALAPDPGDLNAVLLLGMYLVNVGQSEQALKHFDRMIAEHPDFLPAWYEKGLLLEEELGDFSGALEFYQAIVVNKRKSLSRKTGGGELRRPKKTGQGL